ncbi:MAG: ABC transporter permease [Verrucomicrobiales bacterium]|nr:ABC transporter permease [Verrucomicrobiales bacterium]
MGFLLMQLPPVAGLPLWGFAAAGCAVAVVALLAGPALALPGRLLSGRAGAWLGLEGQLALAQVRGSSSRLAVSVAALAVSLSLTIAIAIMVSSFRQTVVVWVAQSMGADLYARPAQPPRSTGAPAFSRATVETVRSHPAVEAVEGYRSLDLPFRDRLIKLGTGDLPLLLERPGRLALKTAGDRERLLRRALEGEGVLVSEAFERRFDLGAGDEVQLETPHGPARFPIVAVFYDYSSDRGTLTMDQALFERWFGEANPTHLAIYTRAGFDPDEVRQELLRRTAGTRVMFFTNASLRAEVLRIFDATFAITWALELIAILVAMAGVAATLLTLILDRREEIRLLRLAGAEPRQVRRTVWIEAGLLGAVSQLLGLAAGWVLSLLLIRVINPQSFGWTIQFHLPWGFLLGASLLTVAATAAAGWLPARQATRAGSGLNPPVRA